uniref:Aurora kinase n=1 Tax=Pyrodinium bahamense TaxID=73915 RepID=A0A7S0A3F5_9DINO
MLHQNPLRPLFLNEVGGRMSCGRQQCKRTARTTPFYCRCGLEFCSEACFIPEWHAEHQQKCPHAEAIKAEVAERQAGTGTRGGAALLVAIALSRTRPVLASGAVPPAPAAAAAATEAAPVAEPGSDPSVASGALAAGLTAHGAGVGATGKVPAKPAQLRYSLGDFESVGAPLGGGSYGKVTKVVHKRTNEVFAMKVIPKQKVLDHQMENYLAREVKTQLRLQHPNILKLIYYFEDVDNVHLLLEFASGGALFSVLKKRGKLPEADAARYYTDVAMALDHLHSKGVVHRDLKPENILMCEGDVAKLADFGWCAEVDRGGAPRHTFCGTWDYLSPEMVQSEPHDHSVDIWAIGVLLYEMLTSRSPFAASSQVQALMRITKVDLRVPEYVSAEAKDLLHKLLVKEPQARLGLAKSVEHPWVHQFVPDIQAHLAENAAKNAAAVERAAAAAAATMEASTSAAAAALSPAERASAALRAAEAAALDAMGRQTAPDDSGCSTVSAAEWPGESLAPPLASGATQLDATSEFSEPMPTVPNELPLPAPAPAMGERPFPAESGPALSTMPWDRSLHDEKTLDLMTPRTQTVRSSSVSSISQSQATLQPDLLFGAGASLPQDSGPPLPGAFLPNATTALLRALHAPISPRPAGTAEEAATPKERLPEATANFLGALRSDSITGDLNARAPPLPSVGTQQLTREALDRLPSPGSLSPTPQPPAKKVEMRGLREKIAERRAQLEQERNALEEQQHQLEEHEKHLDHQAKPFSGSTKCSSSSPSLPFVARSRTSENGLPGYVETPSNFSSPRPVQSPSAQACHAPAHGLETPRRTASSEGTEPSGSSAFEEIRSWVRRKTGERILPGGPDGEVGRSCNYMGTTALREPGELKAGDAAGCPSGVKMSRHHSCPVDDVDSTMSSLSSEISKDSRPADMDGVGGCGRGLRPMAHTRSRQRMGCNVPST